MLDKIRQMITGSGSPKRRVAYDRLVPDPKRTQIYFSFWLQSLRKATGEGDAAWHEQQAFLASLDARGLIQSKDGIPLDSPFLGEVLEQLHKWKREPHFKGTGVFNFKLNADVEPGCEWFKIHRWRGVPVENQNFVCRADRMPSGMDWGHQEFVSERTRAAIESAGLRGAEFTWVGDVGRYQARQWYHLMATEPIWSGLAHPFLNSPLEPGEVVRLGVPIADALMDIFQGCGVRMDAIVEQFLREFVPDADFAFTRRALSRFPDLYCTARAREVLLRTQCLKKEDFVPVWIWDKPPQGAAIVPRPDKSSLIAHPHSDAEWRAILEQIAIRKADFLSNPKPVCTTTFDSVLERFRVRASYDSPDIADGVKARVRRSETQDNTPPLPKLWEAVLDVSEDFSVYTGGSSEDGFVDSFEVVPRPQLVESQSEFKEYAESVIPGFSTGLLHFAHNGSGDSLAFDMRTTTEDGDCKVLLCGHDPVGVEREWPSIVQLLEESLELEEKEEADGED